MQIEISNGITVDTIELPSEILNRPVTINFYGAPQVAGSKECSLLLFNDGQDIEAMGFDKMLSYLLQTDAIHPILCVGIHAGEERLMEYGMISTPDFKGRGVRAPQYRQFIIEELLPFIHQHVNKASFKEIGIAGFSLGGLSAIDLAWNHPEIFSKVGVFSGSLWWRLKDKKDKDYNESFDRLMHRQIRMGDYHPGQQFFFSCGEQDETEDRNNNGVIDCIDDTIDLMRELMAKGYLEGKDMYYLQLPDGKHDVRSWAKALPVFLKWGWRKKKPEA